MKKDHASVFFVVSHVLEWLLINPTNVVIITLRMYSELSTICENKFSFMNFQIYLWKLIPSKINQDFIVFSVSDTTKVLSYHLGDHV